MMRRWRLSSILLLLRTSTNWMAYLWIFDFVMYPFVVAATWAPYRVVSQDWYTCVQLWMPMEGKTFPQAFTKASIVIVSLCYPYTCCTVVAMYLADCRTMLNSCLTTRLDLIRRLDFEMIILFKPLLYAGRVCCRGMCYKLEQLLTVWRLLTKNLFFHWRGSPTVEFSRNYTKIAML